MAGFGPLGNVDAAWKAVIGGGLSDPNAYDKDAYDKAIAMSVAAQEHLGIENPQPVPQFILRDLSDNYDSRITYQQDKNARVSTLLAGTSGPVARAAVARQLADADLGWIMPVESGYKALSTLSVLASQGKALGKVAANAGIGAAELAAKVVTMAADGNTQATLSPPDFTGAYYNPANRVENLAMHQGSDALGWSIPWPGFGRVAVAEKGILQAIESVSAIAAERAEGLIANKRPGELAEEGEALVGGVDAEMLRYQQGLASFAFQPVPKSKRALDNAMLGAMLARDPARVKYDGATVGWEPSTDYRATFFRRNPKLKPSDYVVHHGGERQILDRYPGLFSEEELNSIENLRGIHKKNDVNLHKKVIRAEWDDFFRIHPRAARRGILDKITEIDRKYGHLFDPPIGE